MLNIKIKSQQWKDVFIGTELDQYINVQSKTNISPKYLESYELVINERCVHIETPKQTATCMLEVLERGGFDELLLDSCGGYAKLVRIDRNGLPTYFIHPPSFKLGPKIKKTRVPPQQVPPRTTRRTTFKANDTRVAKEKGVSVSSFSRLEVSESNSEEDEDSKSQNSSSENTPRQKATTHTKPLCSNDVIIRSKENDEVFETVSQRPHKKKSDGGVGRGAGVVVIVGFAFVVGTMAYVLSNSGDTTSNKKKSL